MSDAPASPPRRSVVIANAGSGKTWTLANRILAWCVDGLRGGAEPDPSRILAVTFTRKAAGEILARILTHAAQGAEDSEAGRKARDDFAAIVGPASADEYRDVLVALCAALPRMQVGTIDGFFHRVALAMPDEVGLPGDWSVGDDHELAELRAQAAARVLEGKEAARLVALLEDGAPKASALRAIEGLLGGTSVAVLDHYRATIARDAGGAATHAQDDAAVDARLERVWRWAARLAVPGDVSGEEGRRNHDALVERWRKLPIPTKKDGSPYAQWSKMHAKVLALLEARDFRTLAAETAIVSLSAGGTFAKLSPPDGWPEVLVHLVAHLRAALVRDLVGRIEGALGVLPVADAALAELQAESGVFSFSDVGRGVARAAVRPGSRVASAGALRSALGRDLVDLAIDEAQDTSAEQFAALRPLLESVLGADDASAGDAGAGGRLLMVGDPKQAIYGWRGGTPGLVDRIRTTYAAGLSADAPLTMSYRSSPILMDFVNRVLGNLADDLPALVKDDELRRPLPGVADFIAREGLPQSVTRSAFARAAEEWIFTPHQAANPRLPGTIAAYACGEPDDVGADPAPHEDATSGGGAAADGGGEAVAGVVAEEVAEEVTEEVTPAERAAQIAATLHGHHPERTIGILVRTNRAATETIDALKALGVAASDEGRGTLLDSPAVVGVVSLLELVDDPGDRIAHFLVSRGPMAAVTGLAPLEEAADPDAAAAAYARRMRGRIADEGLSSVLAEIARALSAQGLAPRDRGRLERMVAIADDFDRTPVARISEFVDALAADEADASSADRIRVMTIHASKGLEFDEVVLPAVNETWGDAPKDWATLMLDPADPPRLVAPLFNAEIRHWIPELSILERDARRRRLLDDLSLFYVAVTRARQGLHLVVDVKQSEKFPTGARLIMRALKRAVAAPDALSGASDFEAAFATARCGDAKPFWSRSVGDAAPARKPEEAPSSATCGAPPADPDVALVEIVPRAAARALPPSQHELPARSQWALDPFRSDDVALRGVLVHECFREIRSADDLVAAAKDGARGIEELVARAATRASIEKGAPVHDTVRAGVARMLGGLLESVGDPGSLIERLRVHPHDEVRNEFAYLRESEGVVSGRIDRLVLHRDAAGKVRGATILDYKTGATGRTGEELGQKLEPGFEQKLEESIEQKLEPSFEQKLEESFEQKLEPSIERKLKESFEQRLEESFEQKLEEIPAEKLEGYFDQMRGYCDAVDALWNLEPGTTRAALLFVDRNEVVEVPRASSEIR